MANTISAKRRTRRNERRHVINRDRVSRIRTFIKKVELAILSGDSAAAQEALHTAQPEIHRGVSKGVMHKNTAARKLSRLASRIKALGGKKVTANAKKAAPKKTAAKKAPAKKAPAAKKTTAKKTTAKKTK